MLLLKDFLILQGRPCIVASGNSICSETVHSVTVKAAELDVLVAADVGVWGPSLLILVQKVTEYIIPILLHIGHLVERDV